MAVHRFKFIWIYSTLIGSAVLLNLAMFPTWSKMFAFWVRTSAYQHAFLVLPIMLYLLWRQRSVFVQPAQPSGVVWSLLGALTLAWVFAQLVNIEIVEFSAALLFFPGLIWAAFGHRLARLLWFPLAYIVFALPWWGGLAVPLQNVTAFIAAEALHLAGVPIYIEGHYIHIPAGKFEIEEACGGLHYLLSALALGVLLAYTEFLAWRRRALVVVAAFSVGIIANWIRVVTVIGVGHVTEMRHPWMQDHLLMGWWLFFGMLLPGIALALRWRQHVPLPCNVNGNTNMTTASVRVMFSGIAALCVCIGLRIGLELNPPPVPENVTRVFLPQQAEVVAIQTQSVWRPKFVGATSQWMLKRQFGQQTVWSYEAFYATQRGGNELVSSTNDVAGEGWEVERQMFHLVDNTFEVAISELQHVSGAKRSIAYWYSVDTATTARSWREKYLEVISWVQGRRPLAAIHAVMLPVTTENNSGSEALLNFIKKNIGR
ncbi:MAG: EpsI family protein [Gammaproteobacteria bacterium]|nr:EpsI family protein [Gammaproteobacteria bacterium]